MIEDCFEQISSVRGMKSESPEPFQVDIPTKNQTVMEELSIRCELLLCKHLRVIKSVVIQTDIQTQPIMESVCINDYLPTNVFLTPIVSEIVFPRKSICPELICTRADIDSDFILLS